MKQFVIYENPRDFPGKFVVRRWEVSVAGVFPDVEPWFICNNLDEARKSIPEWAFQYGCSKEDPDHIREVWL